MAKKSNCALFATEMEMRFPCLTLAPTYVQSHKDRQTDSSKKDPFGYMPRLKYVKEMSITVAGI